MDEKLLWELIDEAKSRGGGLVLNVGDSPQAVVLSMESYNDLLAGKSVGDLLTAGQQSSVETKPTGRRLLITGGAGYIGSLLAGKAILEGHTVVVLDNLLYGHRASVPEGATFVEGDVRDKNLLLDVLREYKIDAVAHLAALIEVGLSEERPLEYLEVNLGGTLSLLWAMMEADCKQLLFASTAAVYGPGHTRPIPEGAMPDPTSVYGKSKYFAEQAVAFYCRHAGLAATILRFFNVAGRGGVSGAGDTHSAAHLIPIILEVAQGQRSGFVINGKDWPTPDGTCVRDYVHVEDVVAAHLAALRAKQTGLHIYNIGTGRGYSVQEVVTLAAEITGKMFAMQTGPRRPGDEAFTVADPRLIEEELGFKARHGLEDIIKSEWTARLKTSEIAPE